MADLPPMTDIKSSNIAAVGHDGEALYIRFHGKGGPSTYRYPTAGGEHHDGLVNAPSAGGYFHQFIKFAHRGEKVG